MSTRLPPHDAAVPPGDPQSAWLFRQWSEELDRRAAVSTSELHISLEQVQSDLRGITAMVVENAAWASQFERTTAKRRSALIGWVQTIRRIGKGTGKRVGEFRAEAQRLMIECRHAVPVWIMPLAKVVENIEPGQDPFDVVIIDEASQSSVSELIAFYLGKQVIVVGDDQQVSPDAIGQDITAVSGLIEEYLADIPNRKLYDGKLSLYDLAAQSFGGVISLLEHFRCANDIIQFSNGLSYQYRIRPLRDTSRSVLKPHVVCHRVNGARCNGKTNQIEAIEIASLIAGMLQNPKYDGATFGVISMVGDEQAVLIEKILRQHIDADVLERRQLLCGNASQFQGDERDVVFLSMVDSPGDGPLTLRAADTYKKRFNVAASRAKEQMWVVHSLTHTLDLKPDDLRRQLIEHAMDPSRLIRQVQETQQQAESEFERQVIQILVLRGYRVVPQWHVGAYRIDMVVVGKNDRLAVECDGERYHTHEELERDIERQMVLERLSWRFERIRGSLFFRDRDSAMKPVLDRLERLGIEKLGPADSLSPNEANGPEYLREIIRVAAETQGGWDNTSGQSHEGEVAEQEAMDA